MKTYKPGTKLINKSDIRKAAKLRGPIGNLIASCAMSLMGLNRINRLYPQFGEYQGRKFAEEAMKTFRISTDILPEELSYIPKEGPFIIVSNHPFGGWDGIVLYHTVTAIRPDFKLLTNFILSYIPNLKDSFMAVNPFSENKGLHSSIGGLKATMETLEKGGCVGIFPSGEVSTYYNGRRYTADKDWTGKVMKLIRNSGVPAVPVYFDGTNSKWFHFVGRIHPILRTLNLPNELIRRSGSKVTMRIGRAVSAGEVAKSKSPEELGLHLRNRVYALEANVIHRDFIHETTQPQQPLAPAADPDVLSREMESMTPLFEVYKYRCYLADTENIPMMMREIGRRREESFRQVGEGTGSAIDTDSFDRYYKHLILWDKEACQLAGAYRLGIGKEIYERYGIDGFYTHTLFKYSDRFTSALPQCIELGRSFLSIEYKKEALPLMLLIKGLFYTVLKYPDCKYLFGPASITSWLPPFYRSLTVYGLSKVAVREEHVGLVIPRTPFKYEFLRTDPELLLKGKTDNIDALDKCIQRLSDNHFRIPTLLKKYVRLNAEILAFNVDKAFNNCVDGMVLLDMSAVPRNEIEMLTKGSEDREELIRQFYGTGS